MVRKRPNSISSFPLVPTLCVGTSSSPLRGPGTRRAFTLLELLLALALTTILLGIVSMAVFSLFRFLDVRRTRLEEAQVARAVLRRFSDDLKGTVHATTLDFSGVSGLSNPVTDGSGDEAGAGGTGDPKAPGTGGAAAAAGAGASGSGGSGASGSGSSGGSTSGETTDDSTGSSQSNTLLHTKPGLYGTQYELEIDVSRLPRIDEYSPVLLGDSQTTKIPSDIKTVAYYVRAASDAGLTGHVGLVRREVDRSVTLYAVENGDEGSLETNEEVLAPEVMAVEFRYFNGTEWLSEWNSEDEGGLPLAVEVAIAVASPEAVADDGPTATAGPISLDPTATTDTAEYQVYRLVVPLPTAEPPSDDTEASSADSTESPSTETTP